MLGPIKWRLLTIVAGLLLANAIDSPVRTSVSPSVLSQRVTTTPTGSGLTVQQLPPTWTSKTARNLYRPYQTFSNIDTVRYVERRFPVGSSGSERNARQVFGSFRYPENSFDVSRRRSDGSFPMNGTQHHIEITTRRPNRTRPIYAYIPLEQFQSDARSPAVGNVSVTSVPSAANTTSSIDVIQSRTDANIFSEEEVTSPSKVIFPGSIADKATLDITGRRSGIQFSAQSQKFENLFQPQGYREDNPSSPNYQFPYSEELSSVYDQEARHTRGISFEQPAARQPTTIQQSNAQKAFSDDVTKFGDVNGPVTSLLQQRQYSEYIDKPFGRPSSYDNSGGYYSSFDEYSRSPRYYAPPKAAYVEYSEYPGPPRSRLITPWKSSRTPRVVFPQTSDAFPTGSASSTSGASSSSGYASDNVVFR